MKRFGIIIIILGWMGFSPLAVAQTQDAPAEAPTLESASMPAAAQTQSGEYELPEGPEGVVAQVGDTKISAQELATVLDKTPYKLSPKKRREIWETTLVDIIASELRRSFLEETKAPDAPDELAAIKESLKEEVDKYNQTASMRLLPEITMMELMERKGLTEQRLAVQARYIKLLSAMISNEELLDFMNKHPDFFNGTKIHLGHIFLSCSPLAPTTEQKKQIEKLQQIAADIQTGKVTFAQAAHEYSQDPSGKMKGLDGTAEYGDLGTWTFYPLAKTIGGSIAMAAFNADVGSLSDIVRSEQGFHLIKVFDRIQGNEISTTDSSDIAREGVLSLVKNQVNKQALDRAPIVIYKAARNVPKPTNQ